MSLAAAALSPRDKLIASAAQILVERGVRHVTARTLAERAGLSASAVNYHFDGRDGLLAATLEAAGQAASAWRDPWRRMLEEAPPPLAFNGWFAAYVLAQIADPAPFVVMREMRHHAARSPTHRAAALRDLSASDAFWTAVAQTFGLPSGADAACADFAEAILGVHGGRAERPEERPWLLETCGRFCARLQGGRDASSGWDGWRQAVRARQSADAWHGVGLSPSGERIASAAADLLGRDGMEGLTHRAVAAQVGLSLAAVSGHFPSRASLVRGAFLHLIASVQAIRAAAPPSAAAPRSISEVAAGTAETLFDAEGAAMPGLLALDELMSAAIRDEEVRRDAEDLRASRGENSALLLSQMVHRLSAPDGLDAHILSILTTGAMRSAYAQEPADRRAWLTDRLAASFAAFAG